MKATLLQCWILVLTMSSSALGLKVVPQTPPPSICSGNNELSRRSIMIQFLASSSTSSLLLLLPSPLPAFAALPMTPGEAEGLGAIAERSMRAKPPKALRPKLSQDFAVLLMRSSYNAMDKIDCIAMDQFQRDFFFIRQAEYLPYVTTLGPGMVQQGELTDPYYFDFISFAQYACISRAINQDPPAVFEEQQGQQPPTLDDDNENAPTVFVATVVKRDPQLTNAMLAPEHSRLVGKAILNQLDETFAGTTSALPPMTNRPGPETILMGLKQLVNLFLINGFAWDGSVKMEKMGEGKDGSGTIFSIIFTTPATLWSGKALQFRRANPINSFVLKTATELVRRAGYNVSNSAVKYEGSQEISTFTLL